MNKLFILGNAATINRRSPAFLGLASLIILVSDLPGQAPIPPDHPSISDALVVWFTDPAGTYEPATGIWSDSSGHGNDTATFTGNRNAESGVDSLPFELTTETPSGGFFNGQTIDIIRNGAEFNSLVTPSLNGGEGFSNMTIISLLAYSGTNGLERLAGIGSFYLDDIRTAFMQAADGTIRKDNGFIASGGALPTHHFIRASVLSGDGVTEAAVRDFVIDDAGAGFTATLNIDNQPFGGGHAKTGDDRLFLGDMRINDDGNSIAQVAFFNAALTDQQIADVAAWMVANPNGGPGGLGFQFKIAHDSNTGNLNIRWVSQEGKLYAIRSESDLAAGEPVSWPAVDGQDEIAATPPENSVIIPLPADPHRFYVIEEFNPPPVSVFADDFESGEGGWTTGSDGDAGTSWELGTPTVVGPGAAHSPVNCFATNLSAEYGSGADVWLRSPVIDLTGAAGATLTYYQFVDIEEGFDFGRVAVLDASDDSELAAVIAVVDGVTADWELRSVALPAEALGKTIKLEFRFNSDEISNFAGWYLDDIEVSVP